MAYIYKITNKINCKSYIGKTLYSIEKRFREHKKDSLREKNKYRPLYMAMNMYGIENFDIEVIEKVDDTIASEREIYWIEYYDTFNDGYNDTFGGEGKPRLNYDLIVETYDECKNQREVARRLNVDIGSVRKVLRNRNIKIYDSKQVMGMHVGKSVVMSDLEGNDLNTFNSMSEANRYLMKMNITKSDRAVAKISLACKGKRKTAYGHQWRFVS